MGASFRGEKHADQRLAVSENTHTHTHVTDGQMCLHSRVTFYVLIFSARGKHFGDVAFGA